MKITHLLHFKSIALTLLAMTICGSVSAKDLNTEIGTLSAKLSKKLLAKDTNTIASVDFVDLQGQTTELGRYLAEQISVEMVNQEGISVVDRANFNSILSEHKLTLSGLVDPANVKKLGRFAGIDALLIGTVTTLDGNIVLTVKAISTETAQIVAASKAVFKQTAELRRLSTRAAASGATAAPSEGANSGSRAGQQKPAVAAGAGDKSEKPSKRAGPLVVTVDSVRPVKRGARVFLTIDSQVATALEVVKGVLIDSEGTEIQIAHSMRTDITSSNSNQMTVDAENAWNATTSNLKPPFDLSIDFGLAYGTMDAKTISVSFHGLKL